MGERARSIGSRGGKPHRREQKAASVRVEHTGEASSPLHDGTVPIGMPSCRGELASPSSPASPPIPATRSAFRSRLWGQAPRLHNGVSVPHKPGRRLSSQYWAQDPSLRATFRFCWSQWACLVATLAVNTAQIRRGGDGLPGSAQGPLPASAAPPTPTRGTVPTLR